MSTVIDIFSGAGGLSEGFRQAGFDVRLGLDLAKHACATHETNFPNSVSWCRDVREVSGAKVRAAVSGGVEVIIGGPNCQGVSERGMRDPDDPRNDMFGEFARLISELRPRALLRKLPQTTRREKTTSSEVRGRIDWLATLRNSFSQGGLLTTFVISRSDRHSDVPENRALIYVLRKLAAAGRELTPLLSPSSPASRGSAHPAPLSFLHRAGSRACECAAARRRHARRVAYSASLILASSIARIGASLGNSASSARQRFTAAGLSPSAKDAAPR